MEQVVIPEECVAKLKSCTSLPSPPKVALKIIEVVKNPEIEIDDVVGILTLDPALSAKILRLANSPLYANAKNVGNLQKAIMLIGLNGILSLALSFSLVRSMRREQDVGLDHGKFWRRALISGSVGLALGRACNRLDPEELFMAAFIQDIGMLVLDQVEPSLYAHPNFDQLSHQSISAHEREHFGADHASVGSWFLQQWNFPDSLLMAIQNSHDSKDVQIQTESKNLQFFQCVEFSGPVADLSTSQASDDEIFSMSDSIETTLKLPSLTFPDLMNKVKELVQESAPLFDINCDEGFNPDATMERARQLLTLRHIQLDQKINSLTAQI